MSDYVLDEYVAVQAGEPYRLLPFGGYFKNGKRRNMDAAIAAKFRLPHFRPPIKLGSHEEATPAGGQIIGLEVREDGLYAIPELTDKGAQAMADGAYRYHSPEVIWEGGLEDPDTGDIIAGPLIVGDALLHTPHLGENVALYTSEFINPIPGDETMENVEVPKSFWEKLTAWFDKQMVTPEAPPALVQPDTEALDALTAERDQLKAQITAIEAEKAHAARIEQLTVELKETKAEPNAEMLAGMTPEQSEWVMTQFKALSAQIAANDVITQELGSSGEQVEVDLNTTIEQFAKANNLSFVQAFDRLRIEQPDKFK